MRKILGKIMYGFALLASALPVLGNSASALDSSGARTELGIYALKSCTSSERWVWEAKTAIQPNWIREFESTLKIHGTKGKDLRPTQSAQNTGKNQALQYAQPYAQNDTKNSQSPQNGQNPQNAIIRSFSEALALRRMAETDQERAFAEYWISRTLYSAGLIHLAEKGLTALLQREPELSVAPFQLAALGCLSVLHRKVSGIEIDGALIRHISQLKALLPQLLPNGETSNGRMLKEVIWEAAFYLFLNDSTRQADLLPLLKDSGSFENLTLAVLHSSQDRFEDATKDLDHFFVSYRDFAHEFGEDEIFAPFMNRAHLLYGRAAYALGKYPESISHYKAIEAHSNEWVHGLSELSWAFLMSEKYREAIGTAIGLQSGALKRTFAPEALMVMSMSTMNCLALWVYECHPVFQENLQGCLFVAESAGVIRSDSVRKFLSYCG